MTVKKLALVAEIPTQLNGCDRLVFTTDSMWVAYVAKNLALEIAQFNRLDCQSNSDQLQAKSVITVSNRVQQWANPTLIKMDETHLLVLYEDGPSFMGQRSLNMVVVDTQLAVPTTPTIICYGSGVHVQYDYFFDSSNCLNIITAGLALIDTGFFPENTSIFLTLVDASSYGLTTNVIWTSDPSTIVSSLTIAKDYQGIPKAIIFATNRNSVQETRNLINEITSSEIVRDSAIHEIALPVTSSTTLVDSQLAAHPFFIVDVTSSYCNGNIILIYSAIDESITVYPRFFYLYGTGHPQEFKFTSVESVSLPRLVPKDSAGNYYLQYLTNNISSHPRSLARCELDGVSSEIPQVLTNLMYTYPFGNRVVSLSMGPTLLNEPDGLATQVNSGTIMIENPGTTFSWLCYYDPIIVPGNNLTVTPVRLENQPRGTIQNPIINGSPNVNSVINVPSSAPLQAVLNNPEGFPLTYSWSSPGNSSVTFLTPTISKTLAVFDDSAPDSFDIQVSVSFPSNQNAGSASIPVTMATHSAPIVAPPTLTTNWHTPVNVTLSVAHDQGFPVNVVVSCPQEVSVGDMGTVPDYHKSQYTMVSQQADSPTLFNFVLLPWHTGVLGDSQTINVTLYDATKTTEVTLLLKVNAFPYELLGAEVINRYLYNGPLGLANQGLGFTNYPTELLSDFHTVKKVFLSSSWHWVFLGGHTVLWVDDWTTISHVYLISYDSINASAVNPLGDTAIVTDNDLLLYNYPFANRLLTTPAGSILPANFCYLDIPDFKLSLPVNLIGKAFQIIPFVPGSWVIVSKDEVCVLRINPFELITLSQAQLGLGSEGIIDVKVSSSKNILYIVSNYGENYTATFYNLNTSSVQKVWKGVNMPNVNLAQTLIDETFI